MIHETSMKLRQTFQLTLSHLTSSDQSVISVLLSTTSLDLGVTACPTTLSDKKRSTPLLSHHPVPAGAQGEDRACRGHFW